MHNFACKLYKIWYFLELFEVLSDEKCVVFSTWTWLFQGPGHVGRNYEKLAVLFIYLSDQHDSKCVRKLRSSRISKNFFMKKFDLTWPQLLCNSKVFEEKWGRKTFVNYTKTMTFTSFLKSLENAYMLRSSGDNFYFHQKYKS